MSAKRKTILMIIPSLGRGGAERIFHLMSREFLRDYNVVECFFNLTDQVYPISSKEYYVLNTAPATNIFQKFVNLYERIKHLREIKRKIKPDFSISQMDGADYINFITKTKSEKVISCIQCTLVNDVSIKGFPGWLRKHFFIRFFYRFADAIVTVSKELQIEMQQFCRIPPSKCRTIYNFADIPEVISRAKEPIDHTFDRALSSSFSIINSGRLEEQKNQKFLLDIVHQLIQREVSCKLFILGDGALRSELIEHAMQLKLNVYSAWDKDLAGSDYDVYFLGFDKNPFKYLAKAKWFVFTSRWEGLPLVLVEAMACQTPIISCDCKTGPREILSERTKAISFEEAPVMAPFGILMPAIEEQSFENQLTLWADTLANVQQDLSVRDSYVKNQKERLKLFSLPFAIESWKALFQELNG